MSGIITNNAGNLMLQALLIDQPVWLGLARSSPGAIGLPAAEFAGNDYARQPCTWTTPANKTSALAAEVRFPNVPNDTLRYYLVCDAAAGGNILFGLQRTLIDGVTPDPLVVASDQEVRIPVNDLVIGPL